MQTITVDDKGTKLAYIDSGAPSSGPYTTLFAVHGQVFTSCAWQTMLTAMLLTTFP